MRVLRKCEVVVVRVLNVRVLVVRVLNVRVLVPVLEIRSKWWMDKCPSIIILGQTISAFLGHVILLSKK